MQKLIHTIFYILLLLSCGAGKNAPIESDNIADCDGALPIFQPGINTTELPGTSGKKDEFKAYAALKDIPVANSAWFSYIADYDGKFYLKAETESGDLNLVVFQADARNVCGDIESGKAEIKRMLVRENSPIVSLTDRNIKNALYPIQMVKGKKIYFVIFTKKNKKTTVKMTVELTRKEVEQVVSQSDNKSKIVDLTDELTVNKTKIKLVDMETGYPVISNIALSGIKGIDINQKASELIFQPTKQGILNIQCNIEGYFFVNQLHELNPYESQTFEIKMQQLKKGKSVQLDDIQFKTNSSEFAPGSQPALIRLRDFLGMNSTIKVEIQGHVYDPQQTTDGEKMSQARAEQVMKYLVNSGINKKRMTAVGYGATKPIFTQPKNKEEIQSNRRVEILIL